MTRIERIHADLFSSYQRWSVVSASSAFY